MLLLLACRAEPDGKIDVTDPDAASDTACDGEEICNGVDDDCNGAVDDGVLSTFYADADADGFGDSTAPVEACELPATATDNPDDCDDADPDAWPGNPEVCDEADNNCDGKIDEGVGNTFYADADDDGYGDPDGTLAACSQPDGYLTDASDCDDTTDTVNPGEVETCDEVDNDCDGAVDDGVLVDWYADVDGDGWGDATAIQPACALPTGYAEDAGDCDDLDTTVHPEAVEICDGEDQDCDGAIDDGLDADGDGTADCLDVEVCDGLDNDGDGTVDEPDATDATTWWLDYDADGYGGTRLSELACDAPFAYVATNDDCDDADATVSPGATEVCNGADDDCDGTIDDGALGATWYADDDGDAYGDAADSTDACDAPSGYVADATDCDDGVATTHPGATEECDGVDDDCDGVIDDGASGTTVFYADADGDGFGDATSTVTDCDAPAGYVSDATDCDDTDDTAFPGAPDLCDTFDEDCDGWPDDDGDCPCDLEYDGTTPYLFCTTALEWEPARAECLAVGYDLVTIDDAAENTWTNDLAAAYGWNAYGHVFWLGLNDRSTEGSFVWSSGAAVAYTNWGSGEPNDSGGEDCAHTWTSYHWNDIPCTGYPVRYICEG